MILVLGLCTNSIFAQCGADGTQPCGSSRKKTASKPTKSTTVNSKSPKKTKPVVEVKADSSGTVYRETKDGKTLVVTYEEQLTNLIFTLEAVTNFTNNFNTKDPDRTKIYIDFNRDEYVDCKDIAYSSFYLSYGGKIGGYIYEIDLNAPCDKPFKSNATLKTDFAGTVNESRPHPIWIYTIPKRELWNGSGILNVRFEYNGSNSVPKYDFANDGLNKPDGWFGYVKRLKFKR